MLCHQKKSRTLFSVSYTVVCGFIYYSNTLWAWAPLKMFLCIFLWMDAVQDQNFVDSNCKCWCLTEFEAMFTEI